MSSRQFTNSNQNGQVINGPLIPIGNQDNSIPFKPYQPTLIGGCHGTIYGCCPDGVTSKNADGSNCVVQPFTSQPLPPLPPFVPSTRAPAQFTFPPLEPGPVIPIVNPLTLAPLHPSQPVTKTPVIIGGCKGTRYGCCPDGHTSSNADGSNCPVIGGCKGTRYGCCPDGHTSRNADGSNCSRPFIPVGDGYYNYPYNNHSKYTNMKMLRFRDMLYSDKYPISQSDFYTTNPHM